MPLEIHRSIQHGIATHASWVGTQQIWVNCYRAFHSTDYVQDYNALLKSMHCYNAAHASVEAAFKSTPCLPSGWLRHTATEHVFIQ